MKFNISSMLNENVYDHSVSELQLIETHISWVILTGDYAYKIKKPVNYGFLDFSTLDKRHQYCEQELVLNSRLAPDIYLSVVPITGTTIAPVLSGTGTPFEFAVKMRQFPQSAQFDNMLAAGVLSCDHLDALAFTTAQFHQSTQVAGSLVDYGDAKIVYQPVEENFNQIREHIGTQQYDTILDELSAWSHAEYSRLKLFLDMRKQDGYIRQCHGDMHLRNLIWFNDQPMAFDCIEFNDHLSWIDVISEVAFLIMDLQSRNQINLANRFINSYLESTGDYAGLKVMSFYLSYRAMVRAKVDTLRLQQKDLTETERELTKTEFESYLTLARNYTKSVIPKLIIMYGLSGVGKSTVSQQLVDVMGYIRIRSDVERKRMFNIDSHEKASEAINKGIYSTKTSEKTYIKLASLAEQVIKSGFSVVIDATFLKYSQREIFQQLAQRLSISYVVLELTAPISVLRSRLLKREGDVSDADLSVLDNQVSILKPFKKHEKDHVIEINTDKRFEIDKLMSKLEVMKVCK